MTKTYLVSAQVQIPYPKHYEVRVMGANIWIAIARGAREIHKMLPKRKHIKDLIVRAIAI